LIQEFFKRLIVSVAWWLLSTSECIPKTYFTTGQAEVLRRFLELVAADGGFWPNEACFAAAGEAMSRWALELVVVKPAGGKMQILLTLYSGSVKEFQGKWCIPGGYGRTKHTDLQDVCSEIAKRELGTDVVFSGNQGDIWDYYWWQPNEHPHGRPLSLFVFCRVPEGCEIEETTERRFFPLDQLPDLVGPHLKFISEHARHI